MMIDILSYFFIFLGLAAIILAIIGCNIFPDYFAKMHAATLGDAIGCPLILIGLSFKSSEPLKLILLALLLLLINPAASYILNRLALVEKDHD